MAERKYLVKTPELCEYVFNVMVTTPPEVIRTLAIQEMAYFKNKRSIRRFADNESLEKTIQLFARIGVPFFAGFGKRDQMVNLFEEIGTQYKSAEKRKALINAMASDKLFFFSSNEVVFYGHMAAQNSHSRVYTLNYDYVKIQQKIADAGIATSNQDMKDSTSTFEMMAHAIIHTYLKLDHAEAMCGVTTYQLMILLALFEYRTTFVTAATIAERLQEGKRVKGVARVCGGLVKTGHLRDLPQQEKNGSPVRAYTLAEKGINAAMSFISHISHKAYYGK